jgi:hypothetical protein
LEKQNKRPECIFCADETRKENIRVKERKTEEGEQAGIHIQVR